MPKPKILVTGASGLIGGLVLRDLSQRYEFSGLSRRVVPGIPYTVASITDGPNNRRASANRSLVSHSTSIRAGRLQRLQIIARSCITSPATFRARGLSRP